MNIFIIILCLFIQEISCKFSPLNLESNAVTIHMNSIKLVTLTIYNHNENNSNFNVQAKSSDPNVADVDIESLKQINDSNIWNISVKATGIFLGTSKVSLIIKSNEPYQEINDIFSIIVIREERTIDKIFTASVAILVSILYINFGCAMDWDVCRKTLRKPIGPAIGCFCQFVCMPLLSYSIGYLLFYDQPEMQLGLFFTGISPSGGASNIWTVLLGGNLNLSITMTTICTIAAFGMMPLWIFTLGKQIFDRSELKIPYDRISTFAVGLVLPLVIGYTIQKKCPKLCKLLVGIMKPFSAILIIFIIIFAIVTNLYLFQLFSLRIILAGMGLPWFGFIVGLLTAYVFKQKQPDIKAIAIETGIQNTGVAIFLLRFSLKPPAGDLTTVIPVSTAIMTPVPLFALYLIKVVMDRRASADINNSQKLQDVNISMISNN